jgi:hypothetical protein
MLIDEQFLIHTDFVTEASRQGIVVSSLRNRALLGGIAECLIKAIEEFCHHPTLQYQWMRWLPQHNTYPWDSFWSTLLELIEDRMDEAKVLRTLRSGQLGYIHRLRHLQPWLRDKTGDPLFEDLDEEIYLAKEYTHSDLELLEPYGLEGASYMEIISRIENDLQKDFEASRMKYTPLDDEWHSHAARALMLLKDMPGAVLMPARLDQLEFIPLESGEWVSASSGPLYYYHSSGQLAIPEDLGLCLVDAYATVDPDQRALLDKFGVIEAHFKDVRSLIMGKSAVPVANRAAFNASFSHLKFMYLSEALLEDGEAPTRLKGLHVYDQHWHACQPLKQSVYLPTNDEYGPRQLLSPSGDAPGFKVSFLHEEYLKFKPETPQGLIWDWGEWMELRLRLRRNLLLTKRNKQKELVISSTFRYIEEHRADRLLGALQRVWEIEKARVLGSSGLMSELRDMEVLCKGADDFSLSEPLSTTYLPLPDLEKKYSRYAEDEEFPFLDLGEAITSDTYRVKWGFLADHLGVGHTDDLRFYLSILKTIRYSNAAAGVRRNSRILALYEVIHARCREADSFLDSQAETR